MAKILKQGASVAAILIAAVIAFLGFYVVIVGVPQSYISETGYINGTVLKENGMFQYHYIGGFFYAIAAVMIIGGILYGKLRIAWIGLVLLSVFSVLFLFSSGAALLPVDFVLMILLIIIQRTQGV